MRIKEVMTPSIEFIRSSDEVIQAAKKMKDLNVGVMPVFEGERLVGMLTDRDIVIRSVAEGHDPNKTKVDQIMTKDVVSCREDDDVTEALQLMENRQIRRLIVRNEENKVIGILSLGDLAVHMSSSLVGEILREVSEPARHER